MDLLASQRSVDYLGRELVADRHQMAVGVDGRSDRLMLRLAWMFGGRFARDGARKDRCSLGRHLDRPLRLRRLRVAEMVAAHPGRDMRRHRL